MDDESPSSSGALVLLLEDDPLIALSEKQDLEGLGYSILHARTDRQALSLVSRNSGSIGLMLIDIDLGKGPDGISVATQLRKHTDCPIIFLTSRAEAEVASRSEGLSRWGFASKGRPMKLLDGRIRDALRGSGLR
jgi:DNA-binding response OmpR family regulator